MNNNRNNTIWWIIGAAAILLCCCCLFALGAGGLAFGLAFPASSNSSADFTFPDVATVEVFAATATPLAPRPSATPPPDCAGRRQLGRAYPGR